MRWMTYVRGIIPLYRVYPVLTGSKGIITVVFYNDGKQMVFAWDNAQLKERAKEIDLKLAKTLDEELNEGIRISEEYLNKKVPKVKRASEAIAMIRELNIKISRLLGKANVYIDAFDEFPSDLSVPIYTSYMARFNNALHGLQENFSEEKLEKVRKEFWWTSLGWENLEETTKEDILAMLKNEHKAIPEVKTAENMSSIFAELHDLRKELQMKSSYTFLKLLEVVAGERGFDVKDMEWVNLDELENPDIALARRRRNCMFFFVGDDIRIFYGAEAEKMGSELLEYDHSDSIIGKCAYPGKVKGKARVCKGVQEAMNIKEGEILITGMTMPDYVPYMKKASAVVTNEGGLTCHAGIICREFKIPCVVGTVHATEIFKTGDLIEVDAEKGVVRVIR